MARQQASPATRAKRRLQCASIVAAAAAHEDPLTVITFFFIQVGDDYEFKWMTEPSIQASSLTSTACWAVAMSQSWSSRSSRQMCSKRHPNIMNWKVELSLSEGGWIFFCWTLSTPLDRFSCLCDIWSSCAGHMGHFYWAFRPID